MNVKILFVTGNRGKFVEAKELLKEFNIEVEQADIDVTEPQAETLDEVLGKCVEEARRKIWSNFIIEDSGLFINSLNGFPGVCSSYVYRKIGCQGILKLLSGCVDRSAYFMTVLAYSEPGSKPVFFKGTVEGMITSEMRGGSGFGYDPIFKPSDSDFTFAEMSVEEKNRFSHRARALKAFASWFLNERKSSHPWV
ncbi:MAG: XTP/dITP diphosphatase [Thermoproteota archaeon]